jgi:two-component system alkaline phosphatase synthesis response regulator PhoP
VVDRVIDVHIGNLRAKIEQDLAHPRYIITVRGIGYKFTELDSQ